MNQLFIRDMSEEFAKEILNWKYEAPYDFYNHDLNADSIIELLDNPYYSVVEQNNELVGYFCIGAPAQVPSDLQIGAYSEEFADIGIGMKPNLTGKGNGSFFFSFVLNHIQEKYNTPIRLTVAKFNQRAIHLYEKFGFVKTVEFHNGSTGFITMVKHVK